MRRLLDELGMRDPSVIQWRADFVEALVRESLFEEAEAELAALAKQAGGAPRPWVLAVVARCRGLMAGDHEFDAPFEEALEHHRRGDDPFERGRTELVYGERLRRARRPREAREPLRSALGTFDALEAEPWAARARAELRASGGAIPTATRSVSRELTGQELEIALKATEGATNREIAAALS